MINEFKSCIVNSVSTTKEWSAHKQNIELWSQLSVKSIRNSLLTLTLRQASQLSFNPKYVFLHSTINHNRTWQWKNGGNQRRPWAFLPKKHQWYWESNYASGVPCYYTEFLHILNREIRKRLPSITFFLIHMWHISIPVRLSVRPNGVFPSVCNRTLSRLPYQCK